MSSEEESELDSDMEEEEDSEDQSSDYDFLSFLVVREQDSGSYDVIPSTWVISAYDYDNGDQTTVDYYFPSEELLGEDITITKDEPPGDDWPQFFGDMLFESDSEAAALQFIIDETKRDEEISRIMAYNRRKEMGSLGTGKKKEAPKTSGTKREQPENKNNPKKAKTSTEPAPAASTSSTVTSKPPVHTQPQPQPQKNKAASKAHRCLY